MLNQSAKKPPERWDNKFKGWAVRETLDWKKSFKQNYDIYLLILPVIIYFIVFAYMPMYGLQIAFKNYSPALGIWGSPWCGLDHLQRFFNSHYFWRLIENTLSMSIYSLIICIPAPIILALLFNEISKRKFRVTLQTISYAPNFISGVVAVSMITMFLTPETGFIDNILRIFGYSESQSVLSSLPAFDHIYVWSGVWQGIGWSSVIYSAAIEGVPIDMYEAASIEGASRLKQIWYITLPTIAPTITILAILAVGGILSVGFEKVFLLQNNSNLEVSEVISTYVYKAGLQQAQYSFASMVGLFNNIINFIVLFAANKFSKYLGETSLW